MRAWLLLAAASLLGCAARVPPSVAFGDCSCPRPCGSAASAALPAPTAMTSEGQRTHAEIMAALDDRWGAPWTSSTRGRSVTRQIHAEAETALRDSYPKLRGRIERALGANMEALEARLAASYRAVSAASHGDVTISVVEAGFDLQSAREDVQRVLEERAFDVAVDDIAPPSVEDFSLISFAFDCAADLGAGTELNFNELRRVCRALAFSEYRRIGPEISRVFSSEIANARAEIERRAKLAAAR